MRNYIIQNGINSQLIDGLLISELPPITKPLMRTQTEEIDGRDGDITIPLGYSAYDKEMIIGLYGYYDIDKVIQYFSSSGEVTFSNEPDKVYKYDIFQPVDFERLAHFRTATVTYHVQPFKMSAIEGVISLQNGETSLLVVNHGNVKSKPVITLYGQGLCVLKLNGVSVLTANVNGYLTVDVENMEAYKGNVLYNRSVSGDYDDLTLPVGKSVITWAGNLTGLEIKNYSRWI